MRPNPMRSTGFVVLSIILHGLAVAAMTLTPVRTVSDAGDRIEVSVGEPADKPGVKEAPATEAESKPEVVAPPQQPKAEVAKEEAPAPAPKPVPAPIPAPASQKMVKATPKPATPKPAATKAVAKATPAKVITQAADPEDTTAPAADKAEEAQEKEEAPVLVPVKETAPAGVEASTDEVPEAKVEEKPAQPVAVAPVEKPAPKAEEKSQPSAAPVAAAAAASTTAKGTSSAPAETGDLTKGGATKEGAVAYTDLKQMPGNRPPVYPMQARLDKRQGNLELLYRVTKEGKVSDVTVAKSSGSKDLDDSAVKAISQFKFYPGQEGWARHPVNFNLKGAVAALPSKLRASKNKQAEAD